MINIKTIKVDKFLATENYRSLGQGIFEDLNDQNNDRYKIPISFELEEDEDLESPVEYILDLYRLYVSEFLSEHSPKYCLVLGGRRERIEKFTELLGKRVYERRDPETNKLALVIQ